MWSDIGDAIAKDFVTIMLMVFVGLTLLAYVYYLITYRDPNDPRVVDLRDLVLDSHTRRLDYKKLAINTAAILQCFTWWRMSMGYEVNSALADPWMWLVFYAVVAGHDLLYRIVKIKAAQAGVLNASTGTSGSPDTIERDSK